MPESPGEMFARRLREARQAAGISQTELARRISERLDGRLDGPTITRIEKRERSVRIEEAVAAAQALDVPLAALVTDETPGAARLRELRHALGEQRSRAATAEVEFQEAQIAMVEIERAIEEIEALYRD